MSGLSPSFLRPGRKRRRGLPRTGAGGASIGTRSWTKSSRRPLRGTPIWSLPPRAWTRRVPWWPKPNPFSSRESTRRRAAAASRSRRAPPPRFPAFRASTAIIGRRSTCPTRSTSSGAGAPAARAELAADEAAREAVRLALAAQVAKSYFALRALDEQVELTRRTVLLREEALGLQRKRRDAGVISEFDLRQLEAETAAVRAQLPPLQREREREEAALSVLLGRTPKQVFESGITVRLSFDERPEAAVVPSGLPSELLLRRPDLVQAERGLAAANARVAVARAEIFPSIALTAALGSESAALSNLFKSGAGIGAVAASVAQPIFAGGRLEARSAAAQARERAALAGYQQAIRNAFGEVRAALSAQSRSLESYDAESARATALAETLRLARLRYQNGVASQLDVIDAERGLLAASVARIEALRAHRAAVADLFRALGG